MLFFPEPNISFDYFSFSCVRIFVWMGCFHLWGDITICPALKDTGKGKLEESVQSA